MVSLGDSHPNASPVFSSSSHFLTTFASALSVIFSVFDSIQQHKLFFPVIATCAGTCIPFLTLIPTFPPLSARPNADDVYLLGFPLFERSEFLIATSKKKKTDSLCVYVRLILVLVLGRKIVYGQNTVYLCLSKYIVFENTQQYKHHVVRSIARSGVSPPGARSDGHHWCQDARTAATCT